MSLPRMSWHIGDYKRDTGHLRAVGHGAYFLLCMHYWATGGLPDDDKQLASIACLTDREWKALRPTLKAFFKGEGGEWKHKRIDEELALAQEKYEKRVSAGKKGGNAKANGKQCSSNATAKPYQPITANPNQVDDAENASARGGVFSDALSISDEVAKLCGHDPKFVPPAWCGAPHHVTKWLNAGWTREQITAGVQSALARRRGQPPDRIQYFEKPIAEFIASISRPLPEVVVDNTPEKINARADQNAGSVVAAADRILERMREFDQPAGGGRRGEDDVRMLSKR